jgi:hypothetical protein
MISTCRSVDCLVFFQLLHISSRSMIETSVRKRDQEAEDREDIQLIEERLEFPH